jgi:sirohydrochlorin ferrochelatase
VIDVVLLSHGSPDPRAAAAARRLADAVENRLRGERVHCAFLQFGPSLAEVCAGLSVEGLGRAVVVPAFLTPAFHVRVDVPAAVDAARESTGMALRVTDPIGADAALVDALDHELPPGPVVLAVAGTADADANANLRRIARAWASRRGDRVMVAHASQGRPNVAEALISMEAEASGRASVAALVLFPGRLPDRIAAAAGQRTITTPLFSSPATVDVVVRRIEAAA